MMIRHFSVFALISLSIASHIRADKLYPNHSDSISSAGTIADPAPAGKTFTLDEIAGFNGSNGKPAYVAIDGVVYDLTPVKHWKKGKHHGHKAGFDLTEMLIKKSPHGIKVLKKLKIVGRIQPRGK